MGNNIHAIGEDKSPDSNPAIISKLKSLKEKIDFLSINLRPVSLVGTLKSITPTGESEVMSMISSLIADVTDINDALDIK